MKLLERVEPEEEDEEEEEEPEERVELEEEDDEAEEEDREEDDEAEDEEEEVEPSSRAPQVSVVLSSTSWAERDTDGLRSDSPGSSMAVSSKGLMKSSMRPPPNGLSSGPARRSGAAQTEAAIVRGKRMYFMVNAPYEPVFCPDFVSNSRCICYTISLNERKIKSDLDFF